MVKASSAAVYRAADARPHSELLCAVQVRMNGGTNIAAAVAKAGSLLKAEPSSARRVLVLLTDGRIDTYQVCEGAADGDSSAEAKPWGCCSRLGVVCTNGP